MSPRTMRIGFAAAILVSGTLPARAWTELELLDPAADRDPGEAIRLAGVPADASVAVELDLAPWPGEIRLEDGGLSLVPSSPLAPGGHELSLYETLADGTIEERGRWTFVVGSGREEPVFREAALGVDATLNAGWRVHDEGLEGSPPDRFQSDGGARLTGVLAGERWRLDADARLLHHSLPRFTGDRDLDLATFSLTGRAGPARLEAGDHAVRGDSLVLETFHRRGLSVGLDLGAALELTGFALASRPVVGSASGLAIDDSGDRVDGAMVRHRFGAGRARADVSALYLDGERSAGDGAAVGGDVAPAAGDAWAVAARGELFGRLSLEGEYAESRFDPDGPGAAPEARDEAFTVAAAVRSLAGRARGWELGLRRQRIGTFFRSLANPSLLADSDLLAGTARYTGPRFGLDLTLEREEDDVADLAVVPRARADTASLSGTYRPSPAPAGEARWGRVLAFSFSLRQSDERGLSDSPAADALDRLSHSVHLALTGAAWTATYGYDRFDDARLPEVLESYLVHLTSRLSRPRWSVNPSLQWTRLSGLAPGAGAVDTVLARFDARHDLVPDRLEGSLAIDAVWQRSDAGERTAPSLSGELDWQVLAPAANRPGLALWLRGNYLLEDDETSATPLRATTSQVFAGARLTWVRSFR